MRRHDRPQPGMPRQCRKKRIDQAARNQEKMRQPFLQERIQYEVGTGCHRKLITSLRAMHIQFSALRQ